MNFLAASSTIHFLLGTLILYLVWHYGVRPLLLDHFHSDLFDLRDNLFDYASEGNIDFEDPRYGTLRMWLNALIRMAHRVTFLDTLVITRLSSGVSVTNSSAERKLKRLNRILSGDEGQELQAFALKSLKIAGKYFVLRSPVMWIIVPVLVLYGLLRALLSGIRDTTNDAVAWFGRKIEDQIRLDPGIQGGTYRA